MFFSNRLISFHHVEASGFFEAELPFGKLHVMVIMVKKALSFNFCADKALQGSADLKGSNTYTVKVCAHFHSCYNIYLFLGLLKQSNTFTITVKQCIIKYFLFQ